jgi:hypothetical protein
MSAQHTPGPWLSEGSRIISEATRNLTIARVGVAADGDYSPANACLIAAAPDLLRALTDLIRQHDAVFAGRSDGMQDNYYNAHPNRAIAYRQARAAIAKATGETT